MKRFVVLAAIILFTSACSHLPQRKPVAAPLAPHILNSCKKVFVSQKIQLIHRITAELPNGKTETFLGISQIYPDTKKLHCVLMTLEGLVLLEAQDDGKLSVKRAVPPFDRPGFAAGMMADIRLVFLLPESIRNQAAMEDNTSNICRYVLSNNKVEEIMLQPNNQTMIHLYTPSKKLYRSVRLEPGKEPLNSVKKAELTAHGLFGYRLQMTLIEAQPIDN